MTEDDKAPNHSPLTQEVTLDGDTVNVNIFEDGNGGWLLEIIDDFGNSTVWEEPFQTDHEALAEALDAIDAEGIETFIGKPPGTPTH